MPPVLTPEERGPRPAWAYDSRERLNLSDEEVAAAIPGPRRGEEYDPATIRKAETGEEHMSRPLWAKLTTYYTELARKRGVALAEIPGTPQRQGAAPLDLTELLTKQNAYLERITTALEKIAGISPDDRREWPPSPGDSTKLHAVRDGEPAPTTPQESRPEEVAR